MAAKQIRMANRMGHCIDSLSVLLNAREAIGHAREAINSVGIPEGRQQAQIRAAIKKTMDELERERVRFHNRCLVRK